VGNRVNIIQEDDTTVEGMVVDFNAEDNTHFVVVPPDENGDALPLVEYPEAYEVSKALVV
jgi:DNA polymerase II small subunit/DNA polymerase delta subunit B